MLPILKFFPPCQSGLSVEASPIKNNPGRNIKKDMAFPEALPETSRKNEELESSPLEKGQQGPWGKIKGKPERLGQVKGCDISMKQDGNSELSEKNEGVATRAKREGESKKRKKIDQDAESEDPNFGTRALPNQRVLYGDDLLYIIFRLHHVSFVGISSAKIGKVQFTLYFFSLSFFSSCIFISNLSKTSQSIRIEDSIHQNIPMKSAIKSTFPFLLLFPFQSTNLFKVFFFRFLELLINLLNTKITPHVYEQEYKKLFGGFPSPLYVMENLIHRLIEQVNALSHYVFALLSLF